MSKVGNISFKLVCVEYARQQGKARNAYQKRNAALFADQGKAYESERLARLAAYKGELPVFSSEKDNTNPFQPLGFERAVELTETPTKVEARKPWRPRG